MKKLLMLGLLAVAVLATIPTTYGSWKEESMTFYCTTSDGHILKDDADYNTAWTATTGDYVYTDWSNIGIEQMKAESMYYIYRAFVYFDTSALPDNITINTATLKLYGYDCKEGNFKIVVQSGMPTYPHDPIVAGDYNKEHYSGNGGEFDIANWKLPDWNNIELNANGKEWINKEGMTKLCLRTNTDIAGEPPTATDAVNFRSADFEGYVPMLVVTWKTWISGGETMAETLAPFMPVFAVGIIVVLFFGLVLAAAKGGEEGMKPSMLAFYALIAILVVIGIMVLLGH